MQLSATALLNGELTLKPLHLSTAELRALLGQFDAIELAPEAAERLAMLEEYCYTPDWAAQHDAAVAAHAALREATETLGKADGAALQNLLKAPMPASSDLRAIVPPQGLEEALATLERHVVSEQSVLDEWLRLTPSHLKPKDRAITLAAYKAAQSTLPLHLPPASSITQPAVALPTTPSASTPHVHGPDCNHSHDNFFTRLWGKHEDTHGHVHGPDCGHFHGHDHPPASFLQGFKNALPRGKAAGWTAGALAAFGGGALAINQLGKQHSTAADDERMKDSSARAGDVAYTINHALSCGTTDVFLQPIIAATFGVNVGCNHPGHHHPPEKLTFKAFAHEAGHYFKGEVIGDLVAVPLTIGVQRVFPYFMHGLRGIIEPAVGWAFRMGANHAAKGWAKQQNITDTALIDARAQQLYEHEVSHLPQAVVWNMFAYPIGAFGQKALGHGRSYPEVFKSKLVGGLVSNGLLIGSRMIFPAAAQRWDATLGESIYLPVTKKIGTLFGVDETATEAALKHRRESERNVSWQERTTAPPEASASFKR